MVSRRKDESDEAFRERSRVARANQRKNNKRKEKLAEQHQQRKANKEMEQLFSVHPGALRLDTAPTTSRAPPGTPLVDMTLDQLKTAKYDNIVHMIETSKRDTELLKAQAVCRQQASLKLDTLFDNEIEARLGQKQPQLVQAGRKSTRATTVRT